MDEFGERTASFFGISYRLRCDSGSNARSRKIVQLTTRPPAESDPKGFRCKPTTTAVASPQRMLSPQRLVIEQRTVGQYQRIQKIPEDQKPGPGGRIFYPCRVPTIRAIGCPERMGGFHRFPIGDGSRVRTLPINKPVPPSTIARRTPCSAERLAPPERLAPRAATAPRYPPLRPPVERSPMYGVGRGSELRRSPFHQSPLRARTLDLDATSDHGVSAARWLRRSVQWSWSRPSS